MMCSNIVSGVICAVSAIGAGVAAGFHMLSQHSEQNEEDFDLPSGVTTETNVAETDNFAIVNETISTEQDSGIDREPTNDVGEKAMSKSKPVDTTKPGSASPSHVFKNKPAPLTVATSLTQQKCTSTEKNIQREEPEEMEETSEWLDIHESDLAEQELPSIPLPLPLPPVNFLIDSTKEKATVQSKASKKKKGKAKKLACIAKKDEKMTQDKTDFVEITELAMTTVSIAASADEMLPALMDNTDPTEEEQLEMARKQCHNRRDKATRKRKRYHVLPSGSSEEYH